MSMPLGKLARIASSVMVFVLIGSRMPGSVSLYEGVNGGIVVVVVIGGVCPLCVRPGLYVTMCMFRCDSRP